MREKGTGSSRGFGFVTYKEKASADKVLNEKNLQLDGRNVRQIL